MYLLDDLAEIMNDSMPGDTDYSFADYVYHHLGEVAEISIHELARRCALSAPTVSRQVARLGFEDYKEFRARCADLARSFIAEDDGFLHRQIAPADIPTMLGEVVVPTLECLDERDLDLFLRFLGPGHRCAILGMMNMRALAIAVQHNLHEASNYHIFVPSDYRSIERLEPGDAVITLSAHGNVVDRTELTDSLRRSPAPSLLLTTSLMQGDASAFDAVIRIPSSERHYLPNNYLLHLFVDMALCRAGLYN